MSKKLLVPALQGKMGSRWYYASMVPLSFLGERVEFAQKYTVQNPKLSQMIQRELKGDRTVDIAEYLLNDEDRFFNAMVVAVFGGSPEWHEFGDIKPIDGKVALDAVPEYAKEAIGYLSFRGDEKLFALDGQHRLAGIHAALADDESLGDEVMSVLFVGHLDTQMGRQKTRALFTTLNKHAVPASKKEIIALDENDAMALVCRWFVEESEEFGDGQISVKVGDNIPSGDTQSLTTIGNLYDVLSNVLPHCEGAPENRGDLKRLRPSDDQLEVYCDEAIEFFEKLAESDDGLADYLEADTKSKRQAVVKANRSTKGGNILFRPVGLKIYSEIYAKLVASYSKADAYKYLGELPVNLDEEPYNDTLWDSNRKIMVGSRKATVRDVLLYMLDEYPEGKLADLTSRYAKAMGENPEDVELPEPIYS